MCEDVFGFTINDILSGIEHTNHMFGGLKPNMTRVISVHGGVDPWHTMGLNHTLNDETPVIFVETTSHCADLSSINSADSPKMKEAKLAEQNYVRKWVQ